MKRCERTSLGRRHDGGVLSWKKTLSVSDRGVLSWNWPRCPLAFLPRGAPATLLLTQNSVCLSVWVAWTPPFAKEHLPSAQADGSPRHLSLNTTGAAADVKKKVRCKTRVPVKRKLVLQPFHHWGPAAHARRPCRAQAEQ